MAEPELSAEGYRAQLKKLGLRPSGAKSTTITDFYLTRDGALESVPKPESQTPEQRRETINKLKLRLGIGVFRG